MDVGGKKLLHGAVAVRAPARNIAHGDVVWAQSAPAMMSLSCQSMVAEWT